MPIKSFRFTLQELGGALGDLGTLLPLMVGLILINGLNATSVLLSAGLFYIASGVYFRIPMPVQPLKVVSAIAISLGLSASVIGAAGLLMGAILLFLSLTNIITFVAKLFPQPVVRGIQLSIGLILLRKGIELTFSQQLFITGVSRLQDPGHFPYGVLLAFFALLVFLLFQFVFLRQSRHLSPSLALLTFGVGSGLIFGTTVGLAKFSPAIPQIVLPSASDFWLALVVLVIPQLPLTLGNAIVGMSDTAQVYFKKEAYRAGPRALSTSMGLANIVSGLVGAMPMCHGSGGLTAHYRLGARTAGANLMVGGLLLVFGLLFGATSISLFSLIPISVLGVLLAIVGIYHAFLVHDLTGKRHLLVAATVVVVTIILDNLAYGFVVGILLYHFLKMLPEDLVLPPRLRHWLTAETVNIQGGSGASNSRIAQRLLRLIPRLSTPSTRAPAESFSPNPK